MRALHVSMFAAMLGAGTLPAGGAGAVPTPATVSYGSVVTFDIVITGGVVDSIDVQTPTHLVTFLDGAPPDVTVRFAPRPSLVDCPIGSASCRIEVGASIAISVFNGAVIAEMDLPGFDMMIASETGGTVSLSRRISGGGPILSNGSDPEGSADVTDSAEGEFRLGDFDDFYLEAPSVVLDLPAGLTPFYWEGSAIEFTVERAGAAAVDVPAPGAAALLLAAIGGLALRRRAG